MSRKHRRKKHQNLINLEQTHQNNSNISNSKQNTVVTQQPNKQPNLSTFKAELYTGYLPHPEHLQRYDEIVPGSAKQIIDRFEKQSNHRMELEKIVVKGGGNRAYMGVISAFIICMTAILSGGYLIFQGHDLGGGILGGTGLASLVSSFIYGTKARQAERQHRYEDAPHKRKKV